MYYQCLGESGLFKATRTLLVVFSVSADPGVSDAKASGQDFSSALEAAVGIMVLGSRQNLQYFPHS